MHSRSVEPGSVRWRLPSTAPTLGVVTAPSPPPRGERVRSTLRRVGAHVVNVISGVVGDDVAGRLVRRGVVRLAVRHTDAAGITVAAPPNSGVAPPGYYMLFVLHQGVPSVASWVQLTAGG